MRSGLRLPLLCLTLAATVSTSVRAEDQTARTVLIVANNRSLDASLPPLRYADDDGALYLQALTPYARRVQLLTELDDDTQARFGKLAPEVQTPTREHFAQTLAELYRGIEQDTQIGLHTELLFIFVGHGAVDEQGRGYLHLADAQLTRAQLFEDVIAGSPADRTHIVLDACHAYSVVAGRGASSTPADNAAALRDLTRFLDHHDLQDHPNVGVLLASSDSRETHEWSQLQAGLFSHQLRSALSGAADVNGDGLLEYSEIAAFVDAANTRLPRRAERLHTFAWPPAQDRHAALIDVRSGKNQRYVVLGAALADHLYVESERGERWLDMNKQAGVRSLLVLPADRDFYVRQGEREALVSAASETVQLNDLSSHALTLAARGASAHDFEQHLFAVPFGDVYYRGFLSGHPQLLAVDDTATRMVDVVAPPDRGPALEFMFSYQLADFLVDGLDGLTRDSLRLEHGVRIDVGAALTPWLTTYLALEAGNVSLRGVQAHTSNRMALMLGASGRLRPWSTVQLDAAAELGYGLMTLHADAATSMDPSVGLARLRFGAAYKLWQGLWLRAGVSWLAALLTLDSNEAFRQRPELSLGLGWALR